MFFREQGETNNREYVVMNIPIQKMEKMSYEFK